jgi:citrate synthase
VLIKEKIAEQLPAWRERVKKLLKESGNVKVGEITINQVYGGMRDVRGLVTDISYVDPIEGIRLRGYTIPELLEKLPRLPGAEIPFVGGLYYLLLVGELPTFSQAMQVEQEWKTRGNPPGYVFDVLKAMPADSHPMTMFSTAILVMQRESFFAKHYHTLQKENYWEAMLEDSLNLTAVLPEIAATIYRMKYRGGNLRNSNPELDWAGNFSQLMDVQDPGYAELSRLYFIIHSDHESGNVSAHATHLVGSALSDIYYAASACLDGLAGPLHGLANQECLAWLLKVYNEMGGVPSKDQLRQYAWDTLNSGHVIPGYGHAVLRKTDPRFTAQFEFAKAHMPQDEIFQLASLVYEVVPQVLIEQGKARDPWPNVDAISGALQQHYGVKEFDFYTVLFGVSRLLGVTANAVWARALGQPIERPKSLTTAMLEEIAANAHSSI